MPTPCFWFESQAGVAFSTYEKAFPSSAITFSNGFLSELSLGTSKIAGMNGGPMFSPNRSLSIYAELASAQAVNHAYDLLHHNGVVLMALDTYDWSERYAWVQDKWGVNWQLTVAPHQVEKLCPALMFGSEQQGRARQALDFYLSIFKDSQTLLLADAGTKGLDGRPEILHAQVLLDGTKMILFDSAVSQEVSFTEGASLMLPVETQDEIDHYWDSLVGGGGAEGQCGWCKDRFGVSWQIFPSNLGQWLSDPQKEGRAGAKMRKMTKLDLAALRDA